MRTTRRPLLASVFFLAACSAADATPPDTTGEQVNQSAESLTYNGIYTPGNGGSDGNNGIWNATWKGNVSAFCGTGESSYLAGGTIPVRWVVPSTTFSVTLPILILSHGINGKNIDLDWLQQSLAKAGYITLALQHERNGGCGGLPIPPPDADMVTRNTDVDTVVSNIGNIINALNAAYHVSRPQVTFTHDGHVGFAGYSLGAETGLMQVPGTYRLRSGTLSNGTNNAIGAFFLMAGNLGDFSYGSGWGTLGYDNSPSNVANINKPILFASGGADASMYAIGFYDLAKNMPAGYAYSMHAQGLDHAQYYGTSSPDWKTAMQQMALAMFDARLMDGTFFRNSAATTSLNNATSTSGGYRVFKSNNASVASIGSTPLDGSTIPGMFAFRGAPVVQPGIADGWYRITPKTNTGLALDVANCGSGNGTNIGLWTWLNNDCQKFYVSAVGGGYYRIQPKVRSSSAVDVASCGGAGANVALYDWLNNDCQKFTITDQGSGWVKFNTKYNSGLALDDQGCGGTAGTNVEVYTDFNNDCQKYKLEPAP